MKDYSVFDIIGPRMTGPSSSHTAGAVRIALMACRIAQGDIASVRFTLYGSFAETGRGHGTDKALIAGILGMAPDDADIKNAYAIARKCGIGVTMVFSDETPEQPNTARIEVTGSDGTVTTVTGVSVGGGNILITEINGLGVEITGEYPTLIIPHKDEPGVIAEVTHVLATLRINIAYMRSFRHAKGEDAYMTIETDQRISEETITLIRTLCPALKKLFVV